MPNLPGLVIIWLLLTYLVSKLAAAKGYSFWTFFVASVLVSPLITGLYLRFLPHRAPVRPRTSPPAPAAPVDGPAPVHAIVLTPGWRARAASAAAPDFEALRRELGLEVPEDYRLLLAASEGFDGRFGATRLILHSAEQMPGAHRDARAAEFFPGLVLLGSDGAGRLFAFDSTIGRYVVVPNMGSPKEGVPLGLTVEEFLDRVHDGRLDRD